MFLNPTPIHFKGCKNVKFLEYKGLQQKTGNQQKICEDFEASFKMVHIFCK